MNSKKIREFVLLEKSTPRKIVQNILIKIFLESKAWRGTNAMSLFFSGKL